MRISVCAVAAVFSLGAWGAQIGDAESFVSAMTTEPSGEHTLTASIDLADSGFETVPEFSGTLDGAGYTISGLGQKPLFTLLTGTVRGLTVDGSIDGVQGDNTVVSGKAFAPIADVASNSLMVACVTKGYTISTASKGSMAAGMVRVAKDGARFIGCSTGPSMYLNANVNAGVGGLVANVSSTVYNGEYVVRFVSCTNTASLKLSTASSNPLAMGGIVGDVNHYSDAVPYSEFVDCVNLGVIVGHSYTCAGGIVGRVAGTGASGVSASYAVNFFGCQNLAPISCASNSNNDNLGGIVGTCDVGSGKLVWSNCVNRAAVSAARAKTTSEVYVGGIVGYISNPGKNLGTDKFVNCANYADLEGRVVGGILGHMTANDGWNWGKLYIRNCANYGRLRGYGEEDANGGDGPTAGQLYGTFSGTSKVNATIVQGLYNCWTFNDGLIATGSSRSYTEAVGVQSLMTAGYSNEAALQALNAGVTVESGYEPWVQGRFYPELACFASAPTPGKIDVIFRDWNGETLGTAAVDAGTAATAPADPLRAGYTFTGWDVAFDAVTGPTAVTALYEAFEYTYTFDTLGGSAVAPITQAYETAVTVPEDPVRDGYVFKGWSTDKATAKPVDSPMILGGCTYYAVWVPVEGVASYKIKAFNLLHFRAKQTSSTPSADYANQFKSLLTDNAVSVFSCDDYKNSAAGYIDPITPEGYTLSAKSFNGSNDASVRVEGAKDERFEFLTGVLGTSNKPLSNGTSGYGVFEDLQSGAKILVVNAFFYSASNKAQSFATYLKQLPGHLQSLKTLYPEALQIVCCDYHNIATASDLATAYGGDWESVRDAVVEATGYTAVQAGSDYQWVFSELPPKTFSVTPVTTATTVANSTAYVIELVYGIPPAGFSLFLR